MKDIVFVGLFGYIFYWHFGIEVFIELGVTLLVVIDSSLPEIPLPAVHEVLVAALFEG